MSIPCNIEAEREVLGALLYDYQEVSVKFSKLVADDFYDETHRKIFNVMVEMLKQRLPVTPITVYEKDNSLDMLMLLDLSGAIATTGMVDHYIKILKENTSKRKLIRACKKMMNDIENGSVEDLRDYAYRFTGFVEQSVTQTRSSLVPLQDVINQNIAEVNAIARGQGKKDIRTGYLNIDLKTHGIDESALVIIGARPSVGKTAFAMNLAMKASRQNNFDAAFFSLEMSGSQIAYRVMSNIGRISHEEIKNGNIVRKEPEQLSKIAELSQQYKIWIDDGTTTKVADIKEKCMNMKRTKNLGLIVIDYLQLMKPSRNNMSRYEATSEISRDLKLMAAELKVPIIALSQLNRAVEGKENKEPKMSDLRDSGSIEQDADIIMLMHRDDYQKEDTGSASLTKVNLVKVRNGKTGTAEFYFYKDHTLFKEVDYTQKDIRHENK